MYKRHTVLFDWVSMLLSYETDIYDRPRRYTYDFLMKPLILLQTHQTCHVFLLLCTLNLQSKCLLLPLLSNSSLLFKTREKRLLNDDVTNSISIKYFLFWFSEDF